jgi:ABC-type polysaccharide/polyol phosphate transport system ATPase subunit
LVGGNGAGKSTLLKLISGIYYPTSGSIKIKGKIAPLIELGAGFSLDFSARENIELYGAILGNSLKSVRNNLEEILDWAELTSYADVPLRMFSTGMISRIAFATATQFHSEIVIMDEILSVGDEKFRRKSEKRIQRILNSGATVILVSHELDQVSRLTDRTIVLANGQIIFDGKSDDGIQYYLDGQG